MSKITKALEKAARERLHRLELRATTKAETKELEFAPVPNRVGRLLDDARLKVDPHIVAATDPQSPIAEQYRILRTNLQSLKWRTGGKVIVVTSAVHEEGKSVTSLNLAMTLARQEKARVVVVDADMRKSSIHKWLGMEPSEHGLSSILAGSGELNGSLLALKEPPLSLLTAGPHPDEPAELLESAAMKRLLGDLRAQFDYVIVDAPPVLPVADPGILAGQADGLLLVVRAGKTQRKTVHQALGLLKQMKANILGTVLTHVEYYLPGYYRYYHEYRYGTKTNGKPKSDEKALQVTSDK